MQVTCGSVVKLSHDSTKFLLHSHEIAYGSGSGQQSVTGYQTGDDANSLWVVRGPQVGLQAQHLYPTVPLACTPSDSCPYVLVSLCFGQSSIAPQPFQNLQYSLLCFHLPIYSCFAGKPLCPGHHHKERNLHTLAACLHTQILAQSPLHVTSVWQSRGVLNTLEPHLAISSGAQALLFGYAVVFAKRLCQAPGPAI